MPLKPQMLYLFLRQYVSTLVFETSVPWKTKQMANGLHTALRPHLRYMRVAAAPKGTCFWVQWSSASSAQPWRRYPEGLQGSLSLFSLSQQLPLNIEEAEKLIINLLRIAGHKR